MMMIISISNHNKNLERKLCMNIKRQFVLMKKILLYLTLGKAYSERAFGHRTVP